MLMSGARRATRHRGRVAPVRRIVRVRNPLSGRRIQATGARFRALTQPGGPLVRNRHNTLDIAYGNYFVITHLIDPSDGRVAVRNSRVELQTPGERAMVAAVVEGREPYEARMRQLVADRWVPQLAEYVGRFEYGPREWLQIQEDGDGELVRGPPVARMMNREGVVRFMRARGIRSDAPMQLPFINVDLNPGGTEGACIQQFLDVPLIDPFDTSVDGIIDTARCHDMPVRLLDLFGETIAEHVAEGDLRAAVVYNKHVYPMTDSDLVPVLNMGDAPPMPSIPRIHEMLEQQQYMLWRRHRTYYTPDGKVAIDRCDDDDNVYEDWMAKIFCVTPPCLGLDDRTLETMRRGTIGLYYAAAAPGTMLACADYLAIDMSKCYYTTLKLLLTEERLTTISMYDRFVDVPFPLQGVEQNVRAGDLLLIDNDLSRYGMRTNLICGKTYNLWTYDFQKKPALRVTAIMRLRYEEVSAQRAMLKEICTYGEHEQKKYAVVNGMFGKLKSLKELWLEVRDPDEQAYYHERHGMGAAGPDLMSKVDTTPVANCRFHVYQAVVHMASATVLEYMLMIERDVPGAGLPVKIKIDSLTYSRLALQSPFDRTGERALSRFVGNVVDWHFEDVRNDVPLIQPMPYRMLSHTIVYPNAEGDYSRNITFVGPPGVGKTYQALALPCDIKACFSNKGARRIGGITLDSALGMRPGLYQLNWDREKIAGKRVFIDEAQAMRPRHWGILKFAYLYLGSSFIFALDPDQIPPVEHEQYPVSEHPFWGDVRRLTVDHRNEPCLIAARQAVLREDFEPDVDDGAAMTMLNIAYTNRTCDAVNAWVARVNGLHWMGPGKYIVKVAHPRSGLCKGEIIYRGRDRWLRDGPGGETIENTFPDTGAKRYVKWAYCVTIHNTIGETFTDPYTIWDMGHPGFSTKLMYTALTRGISLAQITFRGRVVPSVGSE